MTANYCIDFVVVVILGVCTVMTVFCNIIILVGTECIITSTVLQNIKIMRRLQLTSLTPDTSSIC